MLKQLAYLVVASIIAVFFIKEIALLLNYLATGYHFLSDQMTVVFANGVVGRMVRGVIALLAIALIAGLIPQLIYWVIKRKEMPYLYHVIWVAWIMLVTVIAV